MNARRLVLVAVLLVSGTLWPAPTAAAPSAPAPSNVCFIRSLYADLLGRPPSAAELTSGLTYLAFPHTHQQYASTVLTSDTYRVAFIQSLYQRFLGRPATIVEITYGMSAFGAGGQDEDIIAVILSTNEYFLRAGGDNVSFVKAVYRDLLGRAPKDLELTFWVTELNSHAVTPVQFATAILTSDEYRADLILGWYARYLGRSPTSTELNTWLSFLGTPSGTDEQVIAALLGSDEYFARAGLCRVNLPLVRR